MSYINDILWETALSNLHFSEMLIALVTYLLNDNVVTHFLLSSVISWFECNLGWKWWCYVLWLWLVTSIFSVWSDCVNSYPVLPNCNLMWWNSHPVTGSHKHRWFLLDCLISSEYRKPETFSFEINEDKWIYFWLRIL